MKKIFIGLIMLMLSSCYLKGDYTLGRRNVFNDFFYTYNIRYYAPDAFTDSGTETEVVSDYDIGKLRHAVPGGLVASSKVMQKEFYSDLYVRPDKKGAMVSYTVPVEFSDEKVYKIIGETEINEVTYRLLEPNRIGDVVLINEQGAIYPRVGRIYNDRLALLETSFVFEPEVITFKNERLNQELNKDIVAGFEVYYVGIENYRMVFKYSTIQPDGSYSREEQKTYTFPMYDKNISIGTINIEVLDVNESGIDYKILKI